MFSLHVVLLSENLLFLQPPHPEPAGSLPAAFKSGSAKILGNVFFKASCRKTTQLEIHASALFFSVVFKMHKCRKKGKKSGTYKRNQVQNVQEETSGPEGEKTYR